MNELPEDWAMLYLNGSSHYKQRNYSSNLYSVVRLSGAFGYIVNNRYYDILINKLSEMRKPCDGYYMDLQREINCYLSKEKLVKHLDGYSVRAEKNVAYPQLRQ